jgi:peptidoglycan hydrolase CwlO-like protein
MKTQLDALQSEVARLMEQLDRCERENEMLRGLLREAERDWKPMSADVKQGEGILSERIAAALKGSGHKR